MEDGIERRKPYKPESEDLFGPGVEMWNRHIEDNDFDRMDNAKLRARVKVRADFLTGIAPLLAELAERQLRSD